MIRGVSSITMSVCAMVSSDAPKMCFRTGIDMIPGKPVIDRRSSSCSSPASRCDSPSRSRSFVVTLRVGNDGASCPPTSRGGPSVSFDMASSRRMSPSSVISRGVARTLMPTVRNVYDDSGLTFAPPAEMGENDVVRYGSSAPTFSSSCCAF